MRALRTLTLVHAFHHQHTPGALFKYCAWKYGGLRMRQNLALEDLTFW